MNNKEALINGNRDAKHMDRSLGIVREDKLYLERYNTAFDHFAALQAAYEESAAAKELYKTTAADPEKTKKETEEAEKAYTSARETLSNLLLNPPKLKEPNQYFFLRMEDDIRTGFEELCDGCGISTAAAIRMFVKELIRIGRMPFKIEPNEISLGLISREKGKKKAERIMIHMDKDLQEQFTDACDRIGIARAVAGRLYILRCLEDKTLTPWLDKED